MDMQLPPLALAVIKAVIIFAVILQIVPALVYFERRISAWIQDRIGPNRVGPAGLLQPLADVIKLAFKDLLLLPPRAIDRRQLPYLHGREQSFAQASDLLFGANRRWPRDRDRKRSSGGCPQLSHGVPVDQPPAGLPGLRQGW